MKTDREWMLEAVALAEKALGRTTPNPLVGAIIVRDDQILGEGWHQRAGEGHAEVNAIAHAEGKDLTGSTIYVTLEPCSSWGRTGPCSQAVIEAGIKRVVIGTLDPNPDHAGDAVRILEEAGLEVSYGVAEKECWNLALSFFKWIQTKKPMVILKMAMTLDGKIATESGQSQWITGPAARQKVQQLRQWCDAIMVGGETVRCDDPSLTVREPANWPCQPQRLIWSRRKDFDDSLKAFKEDGSEAQVICPQTVDDWDVLLSDLGKKNCTALLLEGGGELAANALAAGVVDQVQFFVAPKILGGRDSRPVVAGENPLSLDEALCLQDKKVEMVGDDILVSGFLSNLYLGYQK